MLRTPLPLYTALTAVGSAIWCFCFAGVGWAAGGSWHQIDHAFHFVDYAVIVAAVALVVWLLVRVRATSRR